MHFIAQAARLGVCAFGLTCSSLEEVFLNLARQAEAEAPTAAGDGAGTGGDEDDGAGTSAEQAAGPRFEFECEPSFARMLNTRGVSSLMITIQIIHTFT